MKLDALLVKTPTHHVRLVLQPYFLDVDPCDIELIQELELPTGIPVGSAIAARVTLREGTRLFQIGSSSIYDSVLFADEAPFVFATRDDQEAKVDDRLLKAREREFFSRRGIEFPSKQEALE